MAAVITDQFRISNADNFVSSVSSSNYYVVLGLANPDSATTKFGRVNGWDSNTPNPTDNLQYLSHYRDTILFGKKVLSTDARRVIRKITWKANTNYDMYRHDYSISKPSQITNSSTLRDSKYYVMNSNYDVYICIENGSSGTKPAGEKSQDEPVGRGNELISGSSGDGYKWKYLFSISPSDILKFDSTEYIVLPNDWETNSDYTSVRTYGNNSSTSPNQIRTVYIEDGGSGYSDGIYDILGDGRGAKVQITTTNTKITGASIIDGGYGYTYGIVDLKRSSVSDPAKLIPIIPPSRGHGYDIYKELSADRVLIYARFDDSTKDFPLDTKFSQIGIIKNPETYSSNSEYTGVYWSNPTFSGLHAIKLSSGYTGSPSPGDLMTQNVTVNGVDGIARGYVASYDSTTGVLKYFRDRSLYFKSGSNDQEDHNAVSTQAKFFEFQGSTTVNISIDGTNSTTTIDTSFNGSVVNVDNKQIDLGVTFNSGVSLPEINKRTGDVVYIDNRSLVSRDIRQKEDIKIILEF